jgi:uracil-DNA glycosylase family 4
MIQVSLVRNNEQLSNYLLWLVDRGISLPNFSVTNRPTSSENKTAQSQIDHAFGGVAPKIVFVGDGESELQASERGPLPSAELQLITNIAKALNLGPEDFHYTNYYHVAPFSDDVGEKEVLVHRKLFIGSINRLKPAGVIILGAKALNLVSGKNLNFSSLRGKIINPELYGIPTIVTHHLRDMLSAPENKAIVWTDLNTLKKHIDQI